jgi:hypothetical protein
MLSNTNTLASNTYEYRTKNITEPCYLLNNVGAELLDRERTHVANELTDNGIAKPIVVEVKNVLDNLTKQTHQLASPFLVEEITYVIAVRVLNQSQRVVCDLIHELDALVIGGMIDTSLKNTTTVAVSGDLNAVRGDRIVYELGSYLAYN